MNNRDYLSTVVIGFRKDYYKHFKDVVKALKDIDEDQYKRVKKLLKYSTKIEVDNRVFVYWQEILWDTKDSGVEWIYGFLQNGSDDSADDPSFLRIGLGKEGDIERLDGGYASLNLSTMTVVDFDDIHMYEYNANFKGNGFITTPMI